MEPRFPHQPQAERVLSGDCSSPSSTHSSLRLRCPPGGLGTHIGIQERAGFLHEVRLALELQEKLVVLARALACGHCAQEQKSEDQTWGRGKTRDRLQSLPVGALQRGGRSRGPQRRAQPVPHPRGGGGWALRVPRDTCGGQHHRPESRCPAPDSGRGSPPSLLRRGSGAQPSPACQPRELTYGGPDGSHETSGLRIRHCCRPQYPQPYRGPPEGFVALALSSICRTRGGCLSTWRGCMR